MSISTMKQRKENRNFRHQPPRFVWDKTLPQTKPDDDKLLHEKRGLSAYTGFWLMKVVNISIG